MSNTLKKENTLSLHARLSQPQQLAFSVAEYFFRTGEQVTYDFYLKLVSQLQTLQDPLNLNKE